MYRDTPAAPSSLVQAAAAVIVITGALVASFAWFAAAAAL